MGFSPPTLRMPWMEAHGCAQPHTKLYPRASAAHIAATKSITHTRRHSTRPDPDLARRPLLSLPAAAPSAPTGQESTKDAGDADDHRRPPGAGHPDVLQRPPQAPLHAPYGPFPSPPLPSPISFSIFHFPVS